MQIPCRSFDKYCFKRYSASVFCIDKINAAGPLRSQRARSHGKNDNGSEYRGRKCAVCVQSVLVYLAPRAEYLRGRPGPSSRPCRSPRTGSGPLPGRTCLLYCKKALWKGKKGKWLFPLYKVDYLQNNSTLAPRDQEEQILADSAGESKAMRYLEDRRP